MAPYIDTPSVLRPTPHRNVHAATLAHPALACLAKWSPPSSDFLDWLRALDAPPSAVELLSLGLPASGCADACFWRIYSTAEIRSAAIDDPNLLRARLLPLGSCLSADPIVLDLTGSAAGSICFIEHEQYWGSVSPFPRAYMRVIATDFTAFLVGVAKDAIPIDAQQSWSHFNADACWRYEPGDGDGPTG